jgi:hypothetical protein
LKCWYGGVFQRKGIGLGYFGGSCKNILIDLGIVKEDLEYFEEYFESLSFFILVWSKMGF